MSIRVDWGLEKDLPCRQRRTAAGHAATDLRCERAGIGKMVWRLRVCFRMAALGWPLVWQAQETGTRPLGGSFLTITEVEPGSRDCSVFVVAVCLSRKLHVACSRSFSACGQSLLPVLALPFATSPDSRRSFQVAAHHSSSLSRFPICQESKDSAVVFQGSLPIRVTEAA